jgi:hypothetical protein
MTSSSRREESGEEEGGEETKRRRETRRGGTLAVSARTGGVTRLETAGGLAAVITAPTLRIDL